ncbi:hypothetical protein V8E51_020018 [Hyaloscypha variabilis]
MADQQSRSRQVPKFPPRPSHRSNDYTTRFRESGLPVNAAKLAFALDKGLVALAEEVWRLNLVTIDWQSGPFRQKQTAFPRILNVLATISKPLILKIIRNELHTTMQLPRDTSLRLPLPPPSSMCNENPVIYSLFHSDRLGVTPTKAEYITCLDKMKLYTAWYDSDKDRRWIDADDLARQIDYAPGVRPSRDWQDLNDVTWKLDDNGNDIPHPRRYRRNQSQKQKIMKFIEQLELRLRYIPSSRRNDPVPWSLCYIGWTRQAEVRKFQHYAHAGADGAVRNLLEAAMQITTPQKQYFMQFLPLANIIDPDDAAIGEHLLSVLASSYVMFGGLNGTVGGAGSVQKNARKHGKDKTWKIGTQSLIKQDVMQGNLTRIQNEIDATAFLIKYKEKDSESRKLDATHEHMDRVVEEIEKADTCLLQKLSEYIAIKKNVLEMQASNAQLDECMDELESLHGLLGEPLEGQ